MLLNVTQVFKVNFVSIDYQKGWVLKFFLYQGMGNERPTYQIWPTNPAEFIVFPLKYIFEFRFTKKYGPKTHKTY